jgi:hypothetical protein
VIASLRLAPLEVRWRKSEPSYRSRSGVQLAKIGHAIIDGQVDMRDAAGERTCMDRPVGGQAL